MNKLVSSLAVVAALAVFVGCSDNDALTEVQNPQPIRFTVTIDNGDITRAQRITKDNFTEYQVWATNGNTKRPWLHASTIEGMFDNNVWKETSNTATWDNLTDKVNTNAFFALSADGGNMTLANAGVTLTELANNDNVDSNQEVAAEKYLDYSMPTTGSLIDLDKQVDIMAAYTSGIAKNAAVPLNFQHILSNIEIKALVTDAMWNSDTHQFDNVDDTQFPFDQDTWFYIRYIVIHGLKAEGQYKFSDGTWTTSGDAVDIKIPVDKFFYYHDLSVAANEFRAANGGTNAVVEEHRMEIEHSVYDDVVVGANSIMVIPQQVTPWDYSVLPATAPTSNDCCIEVFGVACSAGDPITDQAAHEAVIRSYMLANGKWGGSYNTDLDNYGTLYWGNEYPDQKEDGQELSGYFKLSTKFEAGKKYTIWLNLGRIRYDDGYLIESV